MASQVRNSLLGICLRGLVFLVTVTLIFSACKPLRIMVPRSAPLVINQVSGLDTTSRILARFHNPLQASLTKKFVSPAYAPKILKHKLPREKISVKNRLIRRVHYMQPQEIHKTTPSIRWPGRVINPLALIGLGLAILGIYLATLVDSAVDIAIMMLIELVAFAFAALAMNEIDNKGDKYTGKAVAIIGIVISSVSLVPMGFAFLFYLLFDGEWGE